MIFSTNLFVYNHRITIIYPYNHARSFVRNACLHKKRSNVLKSTLFYTSNAYLHIYPLSINTKRFGCISISPIYRCNIFTKKYILANFSWMEITLRGVRHRLVFCDKIQGLMQSVSLGTKRLYKKSNRQESI